MEGSSPRRRSTPVFRPAISGGEGSLPVRRGHEYRRRVLSSVAHCCPLRVVGHRDRATQILSVGRQVPDTDSTPSFRPTCTLSVATPPCRQRRSSHPGRNSSETNAVTCGPVAVQGPTPPASRKRLEPDRPGSALTSGCVGGASRGSLPTPVAPYAV